MLSANEDNIIKTVTNRRRMSTSLKAESGLSGPEAVSTTKIPKIPKTIDATINILVAIFCISLV